MKKLLCLLVLVCAIQGQTVWDQVTDATQVMEGILIGFGDKDTSGLEQCIGNGEGIFNKLNDAVQAM